MQKELIILIIIAVFAIMYFGYKYFIAKDKFKNLKIKSNENQDKFENKEKIIQYFGGDYCPFSNTDSNAYKVIKDFEDAYGNKVTVKYYWVGKDDSVMRELNIEYVPTILNGNNEKIELSLPEDVDTNNLSNNQLKDLLLETIYNKL